MNKQFFTKSWKIIDIFKIFNRRHNHLIMLLHQKVIAKNLIIGLQLTKIISDNGFLEEKCIKKVFAR